MNKSKIEWCDYTWNPVTGCFHGCSYCYARNIANRFGGTTETAPTDDLHELNEPITDYDQKGNLMKKAYPYGFDPTFHKYRINEPNAKKDGVNIFVGSMTDLFGDWVPDEWIEEVMKSCDRVPQHNYMFLTKNPARYAALFAKGILRNKPNFWYGSTRTTGEATAYVKAKDSKYNTFFSIEPLHKEFRSILDNREFSKTQWVIIGAETGNRRGKIIPQRNWIEDILSECRAAGVPVFMKTNLKDIWGEALIQEYPGALKEGAIR